MNLPNHESFYLLRNRVQIRQGNNGLRAGTDAVLLGATPIKADKVLELGCGVAPALLCYGHRHSAAMLYGIEIQPEDVALARANIQSNGMVNRGHIVAGDFSDAQKMHDHHIDSNVFDLVLLNPPFYRRGSTTLPLREARQTTHVEETPLKDWVAHALRYTRQFGWLSMIHRPERLPEILAALSLKAGNVNILPIYSRAGQDAKRVMLFAQKSRHDGCTVLPSLTIHDDDGYAPEAKAILEQAQALNIQLVQNR